MATFAAFLLEAIHLTSRSSPFSSAVQSISFKMIMFFIFKPFVVMSLSISMLSNSVLAGIFAMTFSAPRGKTFSKGWSESRRLLASKKKSKPLLKESE